MRRLVILAVLIATVGAFSASAQEETTQRSGFGAVTVYLQRVYPHRQGFKVTYNRTDLYPAEAYIPADWFVASAGRAELIETSNRSVPYMTVFYRDGAFDFVRLYVHPSRSHVSWGALPDGTDLSEEFGIETLEIQY